MEGQEGGSQEDATGRPCQEIHGLSRVLCSVVWEFGGGVRSSGWQPSQARGQWRVTETPEPPFEFL
jgi:hypothetical protein